MKAVQDLNSLKFFRNRIGINKKKCYTVAAGIYFGFWQDYFCWLYKPGTTEIFYRFETTTKNDKRKGENVRVVTDITKLLIYEA